MTVSVVNVCSSLKKEKEKIRNSTLVSICFFLKRMDE
jgi:hypothetical protein